MENKNISIKKLLNLITIEVSITDRPLYKVVGKLDIPIVNIIKYLNISVNIVIKIINFSIRLE